MNFRVESGELSLDLKGTSHHNAAVGALKVWHIAEESIHLCGVLTVSKLGPRGGSKDEKMFSTASILDELTLKFIATEGEVITMPMNRPEISKPETVAGSRWLALQRVNYQWPEDDKPKVWEYVTRPTRKGESDAVVVVPFLKNPNRLVVIREFRIPVGNYEIGFPAGLIDNNETPEDAARREMEEETGLKIDKIIKVSPPLYSSAGLTDENVIMVFAECSGDMTGVDNGDEKIQAIALDFKAVESLLQEPPCSMSARLWPFLLMMQAQGHIGMKG